MKRVLGLDLGTNSIGFALLEVEDKDGVISFNELASNSITFSEYGKKYVSAKDRRKFRSSRRRNDRLSRRKENVRKLLVYFSLASKNILNNPIEYFNKLTKICKEPYGLREEAINGKELSKDEFTFALYTIISRRGYSNLFATQDSEKEVKESELINSAIANNKNIYKTNKYALPSKVLTLKKEALEKEGFINIAIRNKKDDYNNSLDRELWKEELEKFLQSQKNNKELFCDVKIFDDFKNKILNGINEHSLGVFEQRDLKSVEDMVGFCSVYNFYHKTPQKRVINVHIKAIEYVLRQRIENSIKAELIFNKKTGEIVQILQEDIEKTINFWITTPSSQKIDTKNIFKGIGLKDVEIKVSDKQDNTIQNIAVHKALLEIVDFQTLTKDENFYSKLLETLHYFVSKEQIKKEIKKLNSKNILSDEQIEKISNINKSASYYLSFSLKFINEILEKMSNGLTLDKSLTELGYYKRYTNMKAYDFLPPLNPSKDDIKWLEKNIPNFNCEELFYQPIVSPNVKRVISILRKLINKLISKYGKIDKIIIETARELNSKKDEERIKKAQKQSKREIDEAEITLKANGKEVSKKNILRVRLWKEQSLKCLYSKDSKKPLTIDQALDKKITEIEHFIPRSRIWINSYKNKILVCKKSNQDKSDKHPVEFLKSTGQWDNFVGRVNENILNKDKKFWLTNEENIQKIWDNERLEDRFINDTRSATKIAANYLEHYLFPKKYEHGKGETNKNVIRVTGKAINELKRVWEVHKTIENVDGKKDRETNYHHTIDAIVIALLNSSSKKVLNDFFKQNEDVFKIEALKEKLKNRFPISKKDGKTLFEFAKDKVAKYENNELYVCPFIKKRDNIRGFEDGNKKLIWDETLNNFVQIDKKEISKKLLLDKGKDLEDEKVKEEFDIIKKQLNLPKQNNIKIALEEYEKRLLETRAKINSIKEEIKREDNLFKTNKKDKENLETLEIKSRIEQLKQKQKELTKELELPCYFFTKTGKKQIIRSLKVKSSKRTEAKSIIITDKKQKNRVKKLDKDTYENLKASKIPFVAKLNGDALGINLYNTPEGQVVGLNYFSSIKNNVLPRISEKKIKLIKDYNDKIVISKGDILEIRDLKNYTKEYFICNGGGIISNGGNKLELDSINKKKKKKERIFVTLNLDTVVKPVKIDFFGEITYEEFKNS